MLLTVIAPEVLLGKYWADLENAKEDFKELQSFAVDDEVPWTLSHCLSADMGGFVLRTNALGRVERFPLRSKRATTTPAPSRKRLLLTALQIA
jgi:hypothetical protein